MLYAASMYMKSWFLFVLGFINSPKDLFYIIVALFRNELLTDNTLCCSHVLICGLSHAKNLGVWELRQLFCGRTWKFKLRFVPFLQGSLLNLASTYVKLLVFVSAQYHLIVLLSWGCPLCLLKWIVRYWCLVVLTLLVCGLSDAMILGVWLVFFLIKMLGKGPLLVCNPIASYQRIRLSGILHMCSFVFNLVPWKFKVWMDLDGPILKNWHIWYLLRNHVTLMEVGIM